MNREFIIYSAPFFLIAFLTFILGDYPNIDAAKHNNNTIASEDSTFSLPFNSHIADQSFIEKKYTNNVIPFP